MHLLVIAQTFLLMVLTESLILELDWEDFHFMKRFKVLKDFAKYKYSLL